MRFWPSQIRKIKFKFPTLRFALNLIPDAPPARPGCPLLLKLRNSPNNNMANDGECCLAPPSQSTSRRKIANEAIILRESPPPTALNTTAPADIQGDVTVNSRAYQLEMVEESLKRNTIVAVYSLLLFVAPPS